MMTAPTMNPYGTDEVESLPRTDALPTVTTGALPMSMNATATLSIAKEPIEVSSATPCPMDPFAEDVGPDAVASNAMTRPPRLLYEIKELLGCTHEGTALCEHEEPAVAILEDEIEAWDAFLRKADPQALLLAEEKQAAAEARKLQRDRDEKKRKFWLGFSLVSSFLAVALFVVFIVMGWLV